MHMEQTQSHLTHSDQTPTGQLPLHGPSVSTNPSGGRRRTALHYRATERAATFEGLPTGKNRYSIIRLLEQAGTTLGWTVRLTNHLRLLISYTQQQDWEPSARPIVWLTVREAAYQLGVTECQVRRNEISLMRLGALAFKDSTNHRRFGKRDDDGNIIEAYGLDLSLLATLLSELTVLAETRARDRKEWHHLRHALAAARREAREAHDRALHDQQMDDDTANVLYDKITALSNRPRNNTPLKDMRRRLTELQDLDAKLSSLATDAAEPNSHSNSATTRISDTTKEPLNQSPYQGHQQHTPAELATAAPDATPANPQAHENVSQSGEIIKINARPGDHLVTPPLNYNTKNSSKKPVTTQDPRKEERSSNDAPEPAGQRSEGPAPSTEPLPPRVSFDALMAILPAAIRAWLPPAPRISWLALIEAARLHAGDLGISQHAWGEACRVLGRQGATMALIVIAAKHERRLIAIPGGYLRAMTERAATGELHLGRSIYGLLKDNAGKEFANV